MLLAGKAAVGITSMTPATIVEFARQLGLEGKTKNGKKTEMGGHSTISECAMESRQTLTSYETRDGVTYSPADRSWRRRRRRQ